MRLPILVYFCLACRALAAEPSLNVPPPLHPKEVSTNSDDPGPGIDIDYQTGQVSRRDAGGRLLWTKQLKGGLGNHREPHVLHDAARIYLTHRDGITALDRKTGKTAWHAKGPGDRLHLSGGVLLATECTSDDDLVRQGRWVVGRWAATGAEVFRVSLPTKGFDPWPIREVAGLFLVQASDGIDTKGGVYLIDRGGKVCHRFKHSVLDGKSLGKDRVLLTSHHVLRFTAAREVWAIRLPDPDRFDNGGLVEVPGGDLLVFRYGPISDGGVRLMRLDPRTGKTVWTAKCAPLGVSHSKYHHRAAVVIAGRQIRVTSRGSSGSFVEMLDLKTGKQLRRARRGSGE